MKITAAFVALASFAVSGVVAQGSNIDTTILNYALTLEFLEQNFYQGVLARFDQKAFQKAGYPAFVRQRVEVLANQETVHVQTLQSVLGAQATEACTYDFPYKTVDQALALSRTLESVGVSAYLGAAALITDPFYLTAAGSILSVEARHQAVIAEINGGIGFPSPFDTPLGFSQVYTLAAPFITSCPASNPVLPVVQFNPLKVGPIGRSVQLDFECDKGNTPLYAHILSGLTDTVVKLRRDHSFKFPQNISGTVYIVVSTSADSGALADSNTVAGPAITEVSSGYLPSFVKTTKKGGKPSKKHH